MKARVANSSRDGNSILTFMSALAAQAFLRADHGLPWRVYCETILGDRAISRTPATDKASMPCSQHGGAEVYLPGLSWPCRKDADAVLGRHHPVAAFVFQGGRTRRGRRRISDVGNDKPRHPAKKAEHADMGLDPVRKFLRPGCLGVSVIGGAKDGDEALRFAASVGRFCIS